MEIVTDQFDVVGEDSPFYESQLKFVDIHFDSKTNFYCQTKDGEKEASQMISFQGTMSNEYDKTN